MGTDSKKQSRISPTEDLDKDDDVSEAGTYTIDKDSPEVEAARSDDIDRVFGLDSEIEMHSSTALPSTDQDETSWLSEVTIKVFNALKSDLILYSRRCLRPLVEVALIGFINGRLK